MIERDGEVSVKRQAQLLDPSRSIEYFEFYNSRRIHEALGYATPDAVYFAGLATVMAAAA